jgi:hypothetical protein
MAQVKHKPTTGPAYLSVHKSASHAYEKQASETALMPNPTKHFLHAEHYNDYVAILSDSGCPYLITFSTSMDFIFHRSAMHTNQGPETEQCMDIYAKERFPLSDCRPISGYLLHHHI